MMEHERLAAQVEYPSEQELHGKMKQILEILVGMPVSQAVRTLRETKDWLLDSLMVDGNQERFILRLQELEASFRQSS
jgi:hypothetical protein